MAAERFLLLGVPRSGTTWLANALGRAEGTRIVREPDNIDAEPTGDGVSALGFGAYPVLDADDDSPRFRALWDVSFSGRVPNRKGWRRSAGRVIRSMPPALRDPVTRVAASAVSSLPGGWPHVVVKSTYGIFTIDWLERHYAPKVIVLQRNPMNVISSWAQLGIHGFDLLTRPVMRRRYLDRYGVDSPGPDTSSLQRIAAWVGLLSSALAEKAAQRPEWVVVTHDELCVEPRHRIHELCDAAGLPWTNDIDAYLQTSDRPGEGQTSQYRVSRDLPDRWRSRFDDAQVKEIQAVLAHFPTGGWVRRPGEAARA